MSLSTFVERKDVKEYLRLNVPKPWFQVKADIKAPPLTTSYGWTGTAFDYAMRCVDGCRAKVACVAVYFARFGILHRIPVVSFVEKNNLPALLDWFKATASASP